MRRQAAWASWIASALFAFVAPLAPARADGAAEAQAAFSAGAYLAAAEAGERAGSAEGYALAARALIAHVMLAADHDDIPNILDRAIGDAHRALKRDPGSVEARLQLALALGVRARRAGVMEAVAAGWARKGRRLLDEALSAAPGEPWGYALLGGWHFEVLRRGGNVGARLYGADLAQGRAAFERARALDPADPAIALHFAVALLELDADANAKEARALLEEAKSAPADNAFERQMGAEAARLLDAFNAGGPRAAARAAAARLSLGATG